MSEELPRGWGMTEDSGNEVVIGEKHRQTPLSRAELLAELKALHANLLSSLYSHDREVAVKLKTIIARAEGGSDAD